MKQPNLLFNSEVLSLLTQWKNNHWKDKKKIVETRASNIRSLITTEIGGEYTFNLFSIYCKFGNKLSVIMCKMQEEI
jgi:hypothetical protein